MDTKTALFAALALSSCRLFAYTCSVTTNDETKVVTVSRVESSDILPPFITQPFLDPDVSSVEYHTLASDVRLSTSVPSTYTGGTYLYNSQVRPLQSWNFGTGPIYLYQGSMLVGGDVQIEVTNKLVFGHTDAYALAMSDGRMVLRNIGSTTKSPCVSFGRSSGNESCITLALDGGDNDPLARTSHARKIQHGD